MILFRLVNSRRFRPGLATKRTVLADAACLSDPLGWYNPPLIPANILIENIWLTGLDWGQPLTPVLLEQWTSIRSALPLLEEIKIPL